MNMTDQRELDCILGSAKEFQSLDDYVLTSLATQGIVPVDIVKKVLAESDATYDKEAVLLAIRACSVLFGEFMKSGRVACTETELMKIDKAKHRGQLKEQEKQSIALRYGISKKKAIILHANVLTRYCNANGFTQIDYLMAEKWTRENDLFREILEKLAINPVSHKEMAVVANV